MGVPAVNALRGLGWVGGKSGVSPTGTGRWIAGMLPVDAECYCEPFAGMCGVLLQRQPAQQEIVNDLDERLVNWWRVVREQPDELSWLISNTPNSRVEFERALRDLDDQTHSPLERALDFTIVAGQSLAGAGRKGGSAWGVSVSGQREGYRDWRKGIERRLHLLAERMRYVQLENRDAVDVLARMAKEDAAVVYVDPPYANTYGTSGVYAHDVDRVALTDALRAQRGRVAVSGYGDEWDCLGWERCEHRAYATLAHTGNSTARTEVLWTNFAPVRQGALGEIR